MQIVVPYFCLYLHILQAPSDPIPVLSRPSQFYVLFCFARGLFFSRGFLESEKDVVEMTSLKRQVYVVQIINW